MAVEVEDMPVRVAFAEDGYEPEDVALEVEAFAVGLDQRFGGQLGRAVEGCLHGEGRVFRGGEDRRLPVDRAGRGEGDAPDAARSHRLEHVECRDPVLLEVPPRVLRAMAHVGIRRQVEDELRPPHRGAQRIHIGRVAAHEGEARVPARLRQELRLPRGEVVVAGDLVAVPQQTVHEAAPDEAGTPRDEVGHRSAVSEIHGPLTD